MVLICFFFHAMFRLIVAKAAFRLFLPDPAFGYLSKKSSAYKQRICVFFCSSVGILIHLTHKHDVTHLVINHPLIDTLLL